MKLWAVICIAETNVSIVSIETTVDLARAAIVQLAPTSSSREKGAQYGQWDGDNLVVYRVCECIDAGWLYNGTKIETTRVCTYTWRAISTPEALSVAERTADVQIETGRRVLDPLLAAAIKARAHYWCVARTHKRAMRASLAELCAFVAAPDHGAFAPHLRVLVANCVANVFENTSVRARTTLARALSKECTQEVMRREKSQRALGKSCALQCAAVGAARARMSDQIASVEQELYDLYINYEESMDRASTREQYLECENECALQKLGDANDTIDNLMGISYDEHVDYDCEQWRDGILRTKRNWANIAQSTPLLHPTHF